MLSRAPTKSLGAEGVPGVWSCGHVIVLANDPLIAPMTPLGPWFPVGP
jgi:hypothetical protein